MKIGIFTFHSCYNYGAVLQAFALKSYVEGTFDSTVGVVDYKCSGNDDLLHYSKIEPSFIRSNSKLKRLGKKLVYRLFVKPAYKKKCIKFENFKRAHLSITDDMAGHDAVLLGSDQIWNPSITNGYQDVYFGSSVKGGEGARIAYAASCGSISEFSEENRAELIRLVGDVDFVGVRESSLCDYLKANGINAVNTADPTFLLSKEEYVSLLGLKPRPRKKYVLEYVLQKNDALDELASTVASERGCEVVRICGYVKRQPVDNGIFDAGPIDFLELMMGADYVVTNSFHGTAFSLIFKKNFNVLMPDSRSSRLTDLLTRLSLLNRAATDGEVCTEDINYSEVNLELEKFLQESKGFLNSSIKG
ncbi:MAG: polysaccharide pyruvyl transferase family protein [Clostridia bacterium]|nr:polysaccharide pyruvyl transferase family protein [Clostridia bacterium]